MSGDVPDTPIDNFIADLMSRNGWTIDMLLAGRFLDNLEWDDE